MEKIIVDPEIIATCNALGKSDDYGQYEKEPDCDACLRDLIRFLRKDGQDFVVRRQLGLTNIVSNDLIPLLKQHCLQDKALFDVVLRLLVNLTNPAMLLFKEQLPTEKDRKVLFIELLKLNHDYKVAFSAQLKCWAVLAKFMTDLISEDDQEDRLIFERILILIRNLLHVPSFNQDDQVHDRLLALIDQSGVSDLLILVSEDYCFHVMEILSLMLREQDPEFLAKSSGSNFERNDEDFQVLLARESRRKTSFKRFKETTYTMKNLKSLSDRDMIYHKPLVETISLSHDKKRKKNIRRNLTDLNELYDELQVVRPTQVVCSLLSKLCHAFLGNYNAMMATMKSSLLRKKSQDHDESYYLWAAFFFMQFNREVKTDVSLVSETYNVDSLHYFHTQIVDYIDHLKVEKKQYLPWSRRLHYAVKAYGEVISSLSFMASSDDIQFLETTKALKDTAFYEEEYRELLVNLLKEFNAVKMSRRFLIDLINTNHVFLRLFKSYCLVNEKIVVKKKKVKRTKKSNKVIREEAKKWEEINQELKEALTGLINLPTADQDEDVLPIDSHVGFEAESQKTAIVKRINKLLHDEKPTPAVALLRNARQAWIDDPEFPFGHPESLPEEEEVALKEIFEADFLKEDLKEEPSKEVSEKTMEYADFFKKYCVSKVVIAHVMLLRDYHLNKPATNHAVVKFLYQLGFEFDLIGMLFQASVFRIFQRILKEQVSDNKWSKELKDFAIHTLRKFFQIFPKNDKILVEILFWKNSREAVALEEGYDQVKDTPDDNVLPSLSDDDLDDKQVNKNYTSKEIISSSEDSDSSEETSNKIDLDFILDQEMEAEKKRVKSSSVVSNSSDSNDDELDNSKIAQKRKKRLKKKTNSDQLDGSQVEKLFASYSEDFFDRDTSREASPEPSNEQLTSTKPTDSTERTLENIPENQTEIGHAENEDESVSKRVLSSDSDSSSPSKGMKKKKKYVIESDDDDD